MQKRHVHSSCFRVEKNWLDIFTSQMSHVSNDSLNTQPATPKMTCYLHEHLPYLTAWLKSTWNVALRHPNPNTSWEDIWTPQNLPKTSSQEVFGWLGLDQEKVAMFPSFQIRCWCFWYGDSAIDVETWARFAEWKDSSPFKTLFRVRDPFFLLFKEWGVNLSVIFMIRERYKKGKVRKLFWFH